MRRKAPLTPANTSPLQQKAAIRARSLYSSAGTGMNMEDDDRYRKNMLGSEYKYPMTNDDEPIRKLSNAADLANQLAAKRKRGK